MAPRRIKPNADNCSMSELEGAIRAAVSHREHDRLRAVKALFMGIEALLVAKLYDVHERTLRLWIRVFNRQGIDGLLDKQRPGRPRAIALEHDERLCDLIIRPSQADLAHWTAKRFRGQRARGDRAAAQHSDLRQRQLA